MKRNMIKIESDKTNYSSFNPMQANPMKAVAYRRWSNKSVDSMCVSKLTFKSIEHYFFYYF